MRYGPTSRPAAKAAAIRRAVATYVAAFNRGDAVAVAAHWSANGEWLSPSGERFKGRAAIETEMAAYFEESEGHHVDVQNPTVRFLAPTVAVEEGTATVLQSGESPSETSYIAIHVKQNGEWRLDSVRETSIPSPPTHYGHLSELEWMIGNWVDQDENATIETVRAWSYNRNFISRSFSVSIDGQIELQGTQIIGWDPAAQRIRSWTFDSDGGFGEGIFTRDGNRWIVQTSQILYDGVQAESTNIITYVDDNTFTWQSVDRIVGGQMLPNIDQVTVVRN